MHAHPSVLTCRQMISREFFLFSPKIDSYLLSLLEASGEREDPAAPSITDLETWLSGDYPARSLEHSSLPAGNHPRASPTLSTSDRMENGSGGGSGGTAGAAAVAPLSGTEL